MLKPIADRRAKGQPKSRFMARDFDRQAAVLQISAAILNSFTQLGTPHALRVA
ncbi:MAG: hypothetical protein BWY87_01572 [Deltaproteobacteria bacterium ADurb.Bin510]|nr:MAG: hypothetical protein BWY87_01572 [Deltaproteobacteria bacterium ADurb.Bin510]